MSNNLVDTAIELMSTDPFYREWFAHKARFQSRAEQICFPSYSSLRPFSPTEMMGMGLNHYPFEIDGRYYVATNLRWYCWATRPDEGPREQLAIVQIPFKLFNAIKVEGRAFILKQTTGQHNSPFKDEMMRRGESFE